MEVGIQRTDSQRSQQNGPRVSFNRDVHVKRIGKRPNESTNYPIQTKNLQPPETSHLRREPPTNLDEKTILKEAARVLKQAESVKCKAESTDLSKTNSKSSRSKHQQLKPTVIPNKFHSLPTRKKHKTTKPISRSVSDASAKKSKKPSIFNLFSRKSDTNLSQIEEDARFKESGGRRLIRSKSDLVDFTYNKDRQKFPNKKRSEQDDSPVKPAQLSPIIENTQKEEDYFEAAFKKEKNKETNSKEKGHELDRNSKNRLSNKENSPPGGNIGYTNYDDLDFIPSKPIADINLRKSPATLPVNQSKSYKDMHSSQLPPEKPPLTKGLAVDGMVKRLSMERFSPPPTLSGPAFSYTRPNQPIIYAQLAPDVAYNSDDRTMKSPTREMESPPYRTFQLTNGYNRSTDRTNNDFPSHNNKSEVYLNGGESRPPYHHVHQIRGPTSPTEWKQLSPRNLSDDEGLGFEPRKYFEDELPTSRLFNDNYLATSRAYERSKSPSVEPPIIPLIRSSSPVALDVSNRGRADGMDSRRKEYFHETFNEFNNLSNRREALESKIQSRKFGGNVTTDWKPVVNLEERYSPDRNFIRQDAFDRQDRTRYLSPERDNSHKFHKLASNEIVNKYSPERTHLDMIASPKKTDMKTSRYVHTKYFNDDKGGVKEVYEKETVFDEHGKPHVKESKRKERLDSPQRSKDPLLSAADRYRMDCEPKSLDSQFSDFNRSSPENLKKIEVPRAPPLDDHWHISTLTRDKRQQRSFDKGDSGIENDFRKESFNGDLITKWRKPTAYDMIKACELFIKKERHHTEEMHPQRKKYDFVFRERSIDDGSHFDPRLDKYPKETLRRKDTTLDHRGSSSVSPPKGKDTEGQSTLKREKKIGGFERVKKLFSSSRKKENKELSPGSDKSNPDKDRYMVNEDEMRSRYLEYRGPETKETKVTDISTRRRLSTPRASPLLKRTPSDKVTRPSPLSMKNEPEVKPEKTSWFKSLERKSKKKTNEKTQLGSSSFRTSTEDDFSTLRSNKQKPSSYRSPPPAPAPAPTSMLTSGKNLRFFGDTDLESNPPTISKAATTSRTRPSAASATLNRTQKYSQSAYNLDRIPNKSSGNRGRSTSLQNLENGVDEADNFKRRHHSRSRNNLNDISESGSETEEREMQKRHTSTPKVPPRDKKPDRYRYEEHSSFSRSHERDSKSPYREVSSDPARIEFRKPPPGPPKPARSAERSRQTSYSRERDRLHDSSGTEGDSSLHSQRSVVYLHATTVGDIPQPYRMSPSKRRTMSRDDLNSKKSTNTEPEPMTRTVSRSVSMLAPWTPKRRSDGYEINYSQDSQQRVKATSTIPRKHSGSNSTLNRSKTSNSRTRKYNTSSKEDLSSVRNSSIASASKSGISNRSQQYDKRSSESRSNSMGRRRKQ